MAGEGGSSCLAPGRGAGDGFLFPECGNKLEREKEVATALHSWIQLAPAVGIASVQPVPNCAVWRSGAEEGVGHICLGSADSEVVLLELS